MVQHAAALELVVNGVFDGAEGAIADEHFHPQRKFLDQVSSRDTANRSAINTYRTADLQAVYEKVEHSLAVDPLLVHINVGTKNTLLRAAIPTVIPGEHITLTPEEEIEPVSVRRRYHPLVD